MSERRMNPAELRDAVAGNHDTVDYIGRNGRYSYFRWRATDLWFYTGARVSTAGDAVEIFLLRGPARDRVQRAFSGAR